MKSATRPSALGMSDPVMEFLEILETKEFPKIFKIGGGLRRVLGKLGPGQLGPGQLSPGAQLSDEEQREQQ